MTLMLDPALDLTLRGAAAVLFVAAAWHKLRDPVAFWQAVAAYRLVPEGLARPVSRLVPIVECATALGLLVLATSPTPVIAAMFLWVLYGLAMAINLARGRTELDCGCGGLSADQSISWALVARNVVLVGLTSLLLLPVGARSLLWLDAVTAVFGAAMLVLLYASCEHLLRNAALLKHEEAPS